jgi:ubiquinone/menaquinone biosynthesis C-methylase UbiE
MTTDRDNGTLLEVGAKDGDLTKRLEDASKVGHVVGCDLSENM